MIGGLARRALRWAGGNAGMERRLTGLELVRKDRLRFVPGAEIEDALGVAVDLGVLGIGTIYTRLDGPSPDRAAAQSVEEHYRELLARIAEAEINGELCVAPGALGLDLDESVCLDHLRALAGAAAAQGSFLWLDMGDSTTVDRTLDLFGRLRATHTNTGVCLQANLRRTARDLERLLPIAPAVRLVKGEHPESAAAAFRAREEIDANFLALAVTMLRESRARATMRVALGTHDVDMVEQVAVHAAAAGIPKDAFEVHMLYGVRAREGRLLARSGYTVRTCIPYGEAWYGWYMARLVERPVNAVIALRQALPW